MPYVINLNKTSDKKCKCGSWRAHWVKISKRKLEKCAVSGCDEKNLDNIIGAHVKQVDSRKHYIIPICKKHNKTEGKFYVSMFFALSFVPANIKNTCG